MNKFLSFKMTAICGSCNNMVDFKGDKKWLKEAKIEPQQNIRTWTVNCGICAASTDIRIFGIEGLSQ